MLPSKSPAACGGDLYYDMLVIGSGPAGQKAAIQAAKVGKKVGIIERKAVGGGSCINTGTIPSKSLREAVLFLSGFRQRNLYGASYRVKKEITKSCQDAPLLAVWTNRIHVRGFGGQIPPT